MDKFKDLIKKITVLKSIISFDAKIVPTVYFKNSIE